MPDATLRHSTLSPKGARSKSKQARADPGCISALMPAKHLPRWDVARALIYMAARVVDPPRGRPATRNAKPSN
jgi:hypothetical protein